MNDNIIKATELTSTKNWIIHHNDFGEVDVVTCDDCANSCQQVVAYRELLGDERKHELAEINARLRADGEGELPDGADIVELIATRDGARLELASNDYGDIIAVVEGENGERVTYEDVDSAISVFVD